LEITLLQLQLGFIAFLAHCNLCICVSNYAWFFPHRQQIVLSTSPGPDFLAGRFSCKVFRRSLPITIRLLHYGSASCLDGVFQDKDGNCSHASLSVPFSTVTTSSNIPIFLGFQCHERNQRSRFHITFLVTELTDSFLCIILLSTSSKTFIVYIRVFVGFNSRHCSRRKWKETRDKTKDRYEDEIPIELRTIEERSSR